MHRTRTRALAYRNNDAAADSVESCHAHGVRQGEPHRSAPRLIFPGRAGDDRRRDGDQRVHARREAGEQARAEKEARKAQAASKPKKPKNPWKLERLEARIMELETQLESLNAALTSEEIYKDSDKLRDTQFQIAEVERELEEANAEWESFA